MSPPSGADDDEQVCLTIGLGSKYQYMEVNLQQRKKGFLTKIPDIEKTLAMVQFLRDRRVCHPSFHSLE